MQHSNRIDSFCEDDEHFFGSYEAHPVSAEGHLSIEFDTFDARPPTAEQLAHFNRFRTPVAWIIAAMGSLSLIALGQGLRQNSRRDVVAHVRSATSTSTVGQTSEAPWPWTEFSESATALGVEPTRASTADTKLASLPAVTQASLVQDFTSALLSICRDVRT